MSMGLQAALTSKMHGLVAGLLAVLWLGLCSTVSAEMVQIDRYDQAFSVLDALGPDSLVVFDVDSTLLEHEDILLQTPNKTTVQQLIHKYASHLSPSELEDLISIVYIDAKQQLIEPHVVAIIAKLQERKIPVIALTATRIGRLGRVDSVQQWRLDALAKHSINFTKLPNVSLSALTGMGPSPVYKDGIIFSAMYPKGQVLKTFLVEQKLKPRTIVFFDDILQNIFSMDQSMRDLGIQNVFCFHYTGASILHKPIDLQFAEKQVEHLINHEQWITN